MAGMLGADLHRRLIAVVAAYGLALQTVLSAVAAVPAGLEHASIICSAEQHRPAVGITDRLPPPTDHRSGCLMCPLLCAGAIDLPRTQTVLAVALVFSATIASTHADAVNANTFVRAGLARAPPA
jgi:hypothetical protein